MAGPIPTIPLPSGESEQASVPFDRLRNDPNAFGAGAAEGLEQLGRGIERARAEADALAAQEAETTFARDVLEKVHGTSDPKTGEFKPGFSSLKGHSAVAASGDIDRELTQRRQDIASRLANDRQRRIFLGRSETDFLGARRSIVSHTSEQIAHLRREGLKTRLEVASSNAAASVVTPGGQVDLIGAARQIDAMKEWLDVAAEQQGLVGEDAERFVKAGKSAVAISVMERLLEDPKPGEPGHSAEARQWLEAHRDVLDPKQAAQFAQRLGAAGLRDSSTAEADRIWAANEGDPQKVVAAVRGIKDAELRDAVDARVKRRIAEDEQVQRTTDAPREARLAQAIYQSRGLDRNSQDYLALSDEGKARVDEKWTSFQRSLRGEANEERRRQGQADREARAEFEALAQTDLEAATQLDVKARYGDAVSRAALDSLLARQGRAAKAWNKDRGVGEREFRTFVERQVAGVIKSKRDVVEFLAAVDRDRQAWLDANPGKEPNRDEVRKWIENELTLGDTGGWLSPDRPRYKWPRGAAKFVPRPDEEQDLVRKFGAGPGTAQPPVAPAAPPPAGTRVPSEQLGYPPGGEFEFLPNGKYRRVK